MSIRAFRRTTKSSSAAGHTTRRFGNASTCPYMRFYIKQSHHQLQDTLDVDLVAQVHIHTCVSFHHTKKSKSAAKRARRRFGNSSICLFVCLDI